MDRHIELDQVQDPKYSSWTISDLHLEGDKITVEFLSGVFSKLLPCLRSGCANT